MARTQLKGTQVGDGTVQRDDIDVTTAGQALIRKVIAGTGVTITSTGPDAGTGDVIINATGGGGATAPSPITFTSYGPYDNTPGAGATAVSGSINFTLGQPIVVESASSNTLTISDTAGLTWVLLDPSLPFYFPASGDYQYVWYAIPTTTGSTTITVTRASSGSYFGFGVTAYTGGAGIPALRSVDSLGGYTSSVTPFSATITPTSSGSAVWTFFHTLSSSSPPSIDAGSAIYSSLIIAGNRTSFRIGKTTEPLTNSSPVTISGSTTADFQYAQWINYEVPASNFGPLTIKPAVLNFGNIPVYSKSFSIADASALVGHKFMASADPDSDEYEMDDISCSAYCPTDGTVRIIAHAVPGPVTGNRKIIYSRV